MDPGLMAQPPPIGPGAPCSASAPARRLAVSRAARRTCRSLLQLHSPVQESSGLQSRSRSDCGIRLQPLPSSDSTMPCTGTGQTQRKRKEIDLRRPSHGTWLLSFSRLRSFRTRRPITRSQELPLAAAQEWWRCSARSSQPQKLMPVTQTRMRRLLCDQKQTAGWPSYRLFAASQ